MYLKYNFQSKPMLNKIIFLDRDGVINKRRDDYVKTIDEFVLLPNVAESIKKLNQMGFLIIILTNQSAINRGIITEEQLNQIHTYMIQELKKSSCIITKIYFCPHRPDENCDCRKPKPGLIKKAIKEFDADIDNSWLIGDSDTDLESANSIGVRAIKIDKNMDITKAIRMIIQNESK